MNFKKGDTGTITFNAQHNNRAKVVVAKVENRPNKASIIFFKYQEGETNIQIHGDDFEDTGMFDMLDWEVRPIFKKDN